MSSAPYGPASSNVPTARREPGSASSRHTTAPSRRGAARRGHKRAIVVGAHKMLRIIYVVLKTGRPYYDRTADYDALMVKRNALR